VIFLTVDSAGDGLADGVKLKVFRVVGLDLIGKTLEGSLESLLGGGVDHLGLFVHVSKEKLIVRNRRKQFGKKGKHTWTPASSGDQAMRMILLLYYTVNIAAVLVECGYWVDVHFSAVMLQAKVVNSVAGSLANSTLTLH
jgi:hypothetical protein